MKSKSKPIKRKAQAANQLSNDCGNQPRRSIPIKEHYEAIDNAIASVKASKTLFDDRNDLNSMLTDLNEELTYREESLHQLKKQKLSLTLRLAETNEAIRRELDLDSVR